MEPEKTIRKSRAKGRVAALAAAPAAPAGAGAGRARPAPLHFGQLVDRFKAIAAAFHDKRTGTNKQYSMEDIALSAFAVFFTQSPSFLAHQKDMQKSKGTSNARTLFHVGDIPSDSHIRDMLDPVAPEAIFPVYDMVYEALEAQGVLDTFAGVHGTRPVALDGTWYFSSDTIHCENCSTIKHGTGKVTHYHSAVTPVIVGPGQPYAIPLRPQFITPQDGHDKQDCEIAAAKRWLEEDSARYNNGNATLLGDDLYAHEPFCRRAALHGYHYIFTCKPDSHAHLYAWVALLEPGRDTRTVNMRVKNGKGKWESHAYRYANGVPLTAGADALKVNWCEVTVTDGKGGVAYRNAYITDWAIDDKNVAGVVATGRSRWKIENENNNTLKTKGYHLEHNFGHGKKHLSSLLAAMNILAFLFHCFLTFCDADYNLIRAALPTRRTFFDDIRALLRYMCFTSWPALMDFMMRGLEIGPYEARAD